jgi:hypothetical protein
MIQFRTQKIFPSIVVILALSAGCATSETQDSLAHPIEHPSSISVDPNDKTEIRQGTSVPLHAFAHFRSSKKREVTEDISWKTLDESVRIEQSTLHFGCIHSDVMISAQYLAEKEVEQAIHIRKPLKTLQIKLDETSAAIDESEYVKLTVIAYCTDGTVSDVSCQATWSSPRNQENFSNCGHLHFPNRFSSQAHVQVSAAYGPLSVTETIRLPARRFQRRF